MNHEAQKMLTVLRRVEKATKSIEPWHLIETIHTDGTSHGRYDVTVTNHDALRTMIKRLSGIFTVYLNGTDGWSIDVTRKALLELLYCDQSQCGMGLSRDGMVADVSIYDNLTSITFTHKR